MDIEAQLKPLSQAGRLGLLIKKLTSGEITKEEYDGYLYTAFSDTNTPPNTPSGTLGADVREHGTGVGVPDTEADGCDKQSGEGRGEANEPAQCKPTTAQIPFADSLLVSGRADGDIQPGTTTHPDTKKGKSQKARILDMLSDGEWHDTIAIQQVVYGANHLGSAAIPTRVSELNKDGHGIISRKKAGSVWEYRIAREESAMDWINQNVASG